MTMSIMTIIKNNDNKTIKYYTTNIYIRNFLRNGHNDIHNDNHDSNNDNTDNDNNKD